MFAFKLATDGMNHQISTRPVRAVAFNWSKATECLKRAVWRSVKYHGCIGMYVFEQIDAFWKAND